MDAQANRKTEQLLLYITAKLEDNPNFGSVLLNKVLYYIDNIHYLKYGHPISCFTYVKQSQGPTPKPKLFLSMIDQMVHGGLLERKEVERFGRIQKRLLPLQTHNMSSFSSDELGLIDEVLNDVSDFSATEISNYSHGELGWILAENMEELPFDSFLLTKADLTDDDTEWARSRADTHRESALPDN